MRYSQAFYLVFFSVSHSKYNQNEIIQYATLSIFFLFLYISTLFIDPLIPPNPPFRETAGLTGGAPTSYYGPYARVAERQTQGTQNPPMETS